MGCLPPICFGVESTGKLHTKEPFTEASMVRLSAGIAAVRCAGPQNGPVVLCIHSLSLHGGVFADLAETLQSKGFRVIAPDLYGRGDSPWPCWGASGSMAFYVKQCVDLLGAVGVQCCDLAVGLRLGGGIAVALAAEHPQLVRRICCLNPTGLFKASPIDRTVEAALAFPRPIGARMIRAKGVEFIAERQRSNFFDYERHKAKAELQVDIVKENLDRQPLGFLSAWLSASKDFPMGPSSPGGSMADTYKTLGKHPEVRAYFLWGTEGTENGVKEVTETRRRELRALVPLGELTVFPDTGHDILFERAAEVAERCLRLLKHSSPREGLKTTAATPVCHMNLRI